MTLEIIELLSEGNRVTLDMSRVEDYERFGAMMFALLKVFKADGENGLKTWLGFKNHESNLGIISSILKGAQENPESYNKLDPIIREAIGSQNLIQLNILLAMLGLEATEVTLKLN